MIPALNRLRGTLAAAAVGLVASGCGSGHSSAATKPPAPSSSSIATTTAGPADPVTSSAAAATSSSFTISTDVAYLTKMLVPATTLGKGFAVDAKAELDSGENIIEPDIPDVSQADCSKTLRSDWTLDVGMGDTFVYRKYKNANNAQEATEDFDHFQSPDMAQSFMKNVRQLVTVCTGHTTDTETQSTVTFKGKTVDKLGDEAYAITGSSPAWDSGETLEAVRVGNVVVTTFAMDEVAKDDGSSLAAKVMTDAATKLKPLT